MRRRTCATRLIRPSSTLVAVGIIAFAVGRALSFGEVWLLVFVVLLVPVLAASAVLPRRDGTRARAFLTQHP